LLQAQLLIAVTLNCSLTDLNVTRSFPGGFPEPVARLPIPIPTFEHGLPVHPVPFPTFHTPFIPLGYRWNSTVGSFVDYFGYAPLLHWLPLVGLHPLGTTHPRLNVTVERVRYWVRWFRLVAPPNWHCWALGHRCYRRRLNMTRRTVPQIAEHRSRALPLIPRQTRYRVLPGARRCSFPTFDYRRTLAERNVYG